MATKKTVATEAAEAPKKTTAKKPVAKAAEAVKETPAKAAPKAKASAAAKAPAAAKPAVKAPAAPKAASSKAPAKKTASQGEVKTFKITKISPDSQVVEVAGSFNEWKPAKMTKTADGEWAIELKLPAGQYQYKFVFEGTHWEHDPSIDCIPDGQGGLNNLFSI